MGEEFEINMFGEVSHLPLGLTQARFPHQPPVSLSHKNSGRRDKTTMWQTTGYQTERDFQIMESLPNQ